MAAAVVENIVRTENIADSVTSATGLEVEAARGTGLEAAEVEMPEKAEEKIIPLINNSWEECARRRPCPSTPPCTGLAGAGHCRIGDRRRNSTT